MMSGLVDILVFDFIVIYIVDDGLMRVFFKEWMVMYENKEGKLWGVFFIMDKGVYLVNWDCNWFEYLFRYCVGVLEIVEIIEDIVEWSYWIDFDFLVIIDEDGK